MPTKKKQPRRRRSPLPAPQKIYKSAQGHKEINKLLKAGNSDIFYKAGLSFLNLPDYQLQNQNFSLSRLARVNLRGANLSGSQFRRARFRGVDLRDADLSHADFTSALLFSTAMAGANIEGAVFDGTKLGSFHSEEQEEKTDYKGVPAFKKFRGVPAALPVGARFVNGYIISRGAALIGADLSGQDLRGVAFRGGSVARADFRGANLEGASFYGVGLNGANFDKVDLRSTKFSRCYGPIKGKPAALPPGYRMIKDSEGKHHLIGDTSFVFQTVFNDADLSGMNLFNCRFWSCHFSRPNVQRARLPADNRNGYSMSEIIGTPRFLPSGTLIVAGTLIGRLTRVRNADLSNVNLGRIDLRGSNAAKIDISGADFSKANLKDANWTSLRGIPKAMPKGMLLVKKPMDTSEWNGVFVQEGTPQATSEHYTFADPTANENFRSWFGGSRATSDGKPLVVYHGSIHKPFTAFDLTKIDPHHPGFYFSNDIRIANTYLGKGGEVPDPLVFLASGQEDALVRRRYGRRKRSHRTSQGIYRVYLSLKNPYIYEGKGEQWDKLKDPRFPKADATFRLARDVKNTGEYDGVIFRNIVDPGDGSWEEPSDVYVAFEPTQIKSALVNDGSYSPTDPDMRKNPRRTSRRRTSRGARRKTSRSRA